MRGGPGVKPWGQAGGASREGKPVRPGFTSDLTLPPTCSNTSPLAPFTQKIEMHGPLAKSAVLQLVTQATFRLN